MKIKGHIIAKIILVIPLFILLTMIGVMLKQVPESNVIKQHEKSLSMPTTTFFDRMDRWFELKSDQLYYVVKPMTDQVIIAYSILLSIILVLVLDLTVGVGRSRTEEREELKKQGLF